MFLPNPPRKPVKPIPFVDDRFSIKGRPGPQRPRVLPNTDRIITLMVDEELGGGPDEGEEEKDEVRTFFPESWVFTLLRTG